MALFLRKYVRDPIQALLAEAPQELPRFTVQFVGGDVSFSIGDETVASRRTGAPPPDTEDELPLPDDIDDELPGI